MAQDQSASSVTPQQVQDSLLIAIDSVAKMAASSGSPSTIDSCGQAAKNFTEAWEIVRNLEP